MLTYQYQYPYQYNTHAHGRCAIGIFNIPIVIIVAEIMNDWGSIIFLDGGDLGNNHSPNPPTQYHFS